MKRVWNILVALLLAVALVFSVAACNPSDPSAPPGQIEDPGDDPGQDPGEGPGDDPGQDPGEDPGEDPGQDPGKDPGQDPGEDPDASADPAEIWESFFGTLPQQEYITLDADFAETNAGQTYTGEYTLQLAADETYGYDFYRRVVQADRYPVSERETLYVDGTGYEKQYGGYYRQYAADDETTADSLEMYAALASDIPALLRCAVKLLGDFPGVEVTQAAAGDGTEWTLTLRGEELLGGFIDLVEELEGRPLADYEDRLLALYAEDVTLSQMVAAADSILADIDLSVEELFSDAVCFWFMSQFMPSGVTQDVLYEFIKTYPESPALAVHELFLAGGFPYAAFAEAPQADDSIYTYLTKNYGDFGVADMVDAIYQRDGYVEGSFAAMRDVVREGAANGMTLADVLCELVSFDSERMGCTLREYLSRMEFRRSGAQLSCTFDAQSRLTSLSLRAQAYALLWGENGAIEEEEPYVALDVQATISYAEVAIEAPSADRLLPELGEPVEQGGEWLLPVEWNGASVQNSLAQIGSVALVLYDQQGGWYDRFYIEDEAVLAALAPQVTEEGILFSLSAEAEEALCGLAEGYFDPLALQWGDVSVAIDLELDFISEDGTPLRSDWESIDLSLGWDYSQPPQFGDLAIGEDGSLSLPVVWNDASAEQIGLAMDLSLDAYASNGAYLYGLYFDELPAGFAWKASADGFTAEGNVVQAILDAADFPAWVRETASVYHFNLHAVLFIEDAASGECIYWDVPYFSFELAGANFTMPSVDAEGAAVTEEGAFIPVDWNDALPADVEMDIVAECTLYGSGGEFLDHFRLSEQLNADAWEKNLLGVTLSLGTTWEEFLDPFIPEELRAYVGAYEVYIDVEFTYIGGEQAVFIARPELYYTYEASALPLPQVGGLTVRADGTVFIPVDWQGNDPADFAAVVNEVYVYCIGLWNEEQYLVGSEIPAAFAWSADANGLTLDAGAVQSLLQLFDAETLADAERFDVNFDGHLRLRGDEVEVELVGFWGYIELDENGDPVPTEPVPDPGPDDPEQPEEAVLYPYFEMVTLGEDGAIMTTVAWNDFPPERCSFGFMAEVIYLDEDLEAVGGAEGYWVIYPEDLTAAADGTLRAEGAVDWAAEHKPAEVEGEAYYFISCIFQMSVTDESGEIISIVEHGAVLLIDAR